ncbi:adhesin [Aquipseudomonas alcaligenes]|uniref:Adhesin n=1 Tax=Aquipseudomonas alcaligenes TaxID=43263 RepID=A0A2V4KZB5_AQUAC|nr:adhesin [Pseudomonas alcaligenes]PYC22552.1 adhesin [Pseudomonas alcaligenes]
MIRLTIAGALLASACGLQAAEQQARIEASGQEYSGSLSVNQAAGDFNQQVNGRTLAIGGNAQALHRQALQQATSDLQRASARIDGAAFSGGNGVLGVNQAAGSGNQSINSLILQMGVGVAPQALDDFALAQSVAQAQVHSGAVAATPNASRSVHLDDGAFAGSKGVVQLNQSAGVGNQAINNVGIRVMSVP